MVIKNQWQFLKDNLPIDKATANMGFAASVAGRF